MQRAQIDISLSKRPKVGSQNEISRNDKTGWRIFSNRKTTTDVSTIHFLRP